MDINNDGHVDLLSGSWPGEIFLFKGEPGNSFAAPQMIKDKDGKIIYVGEGAINQIGKLGIDETEVIYFKRPNSLILPSAGRLDLGDDATFSLIDCKKFLEKFWPTKYQRSYSCSLEYWNVFSIVFGRIKAQIGTE